MKKYLVTITETLEKVIEIEAPNAIEAQRLVENDWNHDKYILDSANFTGVAFNAEEKENN